ncbi:hypothetical protein FXV91_10435 [Methanosarcina sp. DH2]|nr:hypothetical protein [Methanosarcina sp. DH2]MCC4770587.1 hypothetical protein [Methanosarcina sp. DH2]
MPYLCFVPISIRLYIVSSKEEAFFHDLVSLNVNIIYIGFQVLEPSV